MKQAAAADATKAARASSRSPKCWPIGIDVPRLDSRGAVLFFYIASNAGLPEGLDASDFQSTAKQILKQADAVEER